MCNAGDLGSFPRSGRSPGEGNGIPTLVFFPGELHGQRSLAGYRPWSQSLTQLSEHVHFTSQSYCDV